MRSSSLQLKVLFKMLVIASSMLLTLLEHYECWLVKVLVVGCTLAAMCWSSPVLDTCCVQSVWTSIRTTFFSCWSCCTWVCMLGSSTWLEVDTWVYARAIYFRCSSWNCSGTLYMSTARFLLVDAVVAAGGGELAPVMAVLILLLLTMFQIGRHILDNYRVYVTHLL